ncbi:hypothetical protein ATN84_08890 [Paramesorhizobium deserti]|uniref:Nucleotide-diphospho-sugar transferase domain-containing protein n=1 Tax=Paramesorhizobium deserti TaxID=1494590 RepID=A0A135HWB0_9HYPH|nr:hypothetical protein [Paramesorhizobium deserti]KXF77480.1 hypothetical protein ATN84_08890 [Paramesorhizobium deserti]
MSKTAMPVIVSYYTANTTYEVLAAKLRKSAERLGLDTIIEPRLPRSSWVENCAVKANFIKDVWRRSERPICWVDADAELLRLPHELADIQSDFAVVKREGWNFYGGQIFFGKSEAAEQLIDRWAAYCSDYPLIWDQVSLGYAWWDLSLARDMNSIWLDENIFSKASRQSLKTWLRRRLTRAAFFHAQESRRSRKPGESKEFGSDDIPQWWQDAAKAGRPFPLNEAQKTGLGLTEEHSLPKLLAA